MTNLTNYHSHCLYCDGRANMDDFIRFAISEGFTSYGISSHAPLSFSTAWTMEWECAYSKEMFQEEGTYYTSHLWITGVDDIAFECSFTVPKGGVVKEAEDVIATLEVRKEGQKYPAELIPVRLSEIYLINEGYEWVVSTVKQELKKDFQGIEEDLEKLQQVIDSGKIGLKKKEEWLAIGITVCAILANEVDGMEWKTLIDGNREAPVLQYKDRTIDPMKLVWSKVKAGEPCNVIEEYKKCLD
jgi:hypothetical protein